MAPLPRLALAFALLLPVTAHAGGRWAIVSSTDQMAVLSYLPEGKALGKDGHARVPSGTVLSRELEVGGAKVQRETITMEFDCAGKQRMVERRRETADGVVTVLPDGDWAPVTMMATEGSVACGSATGAVLQPGKGYASADEATYRYLEALRGRNFVFTPHHAARELCHIEATGADAIFSLVSAPRRLDPLGGERMLFSAMNIKLGSSADGNLNRISDYGMVRCEYFEAGGQATLRDRWLQEARNKASAAGKRHVIVDQAYKL